MLAAKAEVIPIGDIVDLKEAREITVQLLNWSHVARWVQVERTDGSPALRDRPLVHEAVELRDDVPDLLLVFRSHKDLLSGAVVGREFELVALLLALVVGNLDGEKQYFIGWEVVGSVFFLGVGTLEREHLLLLVEKKALRLPAAKGLAFDKNLALDDLLRGDKNFFLIHEFILMIWPCNNIIKPDFVLSDIKLMILQPRYNPKLNDALHNSRDFYQYHNKHMAPPRQPAAKLEQLSFS